MKEEYQIIFCDLRLIKVELGNRPTIHFNKERLQNITKKFREKPGREYDKTVEE